MSASSQQPLKTATATPTLNNLLRMPPPQPMTGQSGGSLFAGGPHILNPSLETVSNETSQSPQHLQMLQQQFHLGSQFPGFKQAGMAGYAELTRNDFQHSRPEFQPRTIPGMPPGFAAPGMPLGPRFQPSPSHIPHSPLQKPASSPASVSKDAEDSNSQPPLVNGSSSVSQSPKPVESQTSGTHPSVAALRQEGPRSRSPSRASAGGSPSAARHSPVSPVPVSVYGNAQPATTSAGMGQSQAQFPTSLAGFNGQNPPHPYGTYSYPGGYAPLAVSSSEQTQAQGGQPPQFQHAPVTFATSQAGADQQMPPYYGQAPPGGYPQAPRGLPGYPPSAFPGGYPQMPYGSPRPGHFLPGALTPQQQQQLQQAQAARMPASNGHSMPDSHPPKSTPSKKPKTAPPNDGASLPSTPGTQSPGNASTAEEIPASPSWPHTPVSPAVSGQRTPVAASTPMAPPNQTPSGKSSNKDVGSIVERLTGPFGNCMPEEYTQRRAFFEALVQFCENRAHPITTQPTVSKQPVDLFKLYHAVKERGGFEAVTKSKGWKALCPLANLNADSSSAGYQLRKHYIRYLLPCECAWDGSGRDPQELIDMVERQKKPKKKKQQPEVFLSHPFPDESTSDAAQQPGQAGEGGIPPFPPGAQFPFGQPPDGQHAPPGQWTGHPQMINGPYSAPGAPQYAQMPPQQQPQYAGQPRMPMQHPTAGQPGGYPSAAAPPPHSGGGEMVARDPFDDGRGTPQQQYHAQQGARMQTPNQSPYPGPARQYQIPAQQTQQQQQQLQVAGSGQPPPQSQYQATPGAQPPTSAPQPVYQMVNSGDSVRSQTPAPVSQQSPMQQQQPRQVMSHPFVPPGGAQVYTGQAPPQQGMTPHMGYMQQPMYRAPHPSFYQQQPASSQSGPQQLPSSSQYPGGSQDGSQSATPPYVHPSLPATPQPTVSSAPSSSMAQYAPTAGPWQQRYATPSAAQSQPHSLLPPTSTPFNGPRMAMMRDKSGAYYPAPHQYQQQPNSVYSGTVQPMGRVGDPKSMLMPGRRDIAPPAVFPPGCVEGTQPTFRKRRKKLAKDIGKVEAWRLMMALKSGLMSESHWSLNVLNVLLYDDSSAIYFGLTNLPGLLEVLVEHLRRSLMEIFPDENFNALEEYCSPSTAWDCSISDEDLLLPVKSEAIKPPINSISKDKMDGEPLNGKIFSSAKNFTRVTRTGRPVQLKTVKSSERLKRRLDSTRSESERNCIMNKSHWHEGGGLTTEHLSSKRSESVEESECLQYAKRLRSNLSSERRSEEIKKSEHSSTDAKLFFRTATAEDLDAVGSNVKTDRASALTDKSDYRKSLIGKCLAVSNILRGLVAIPGNEAEMAKHAGLLLILGRLMLIHHEHLSSSCKFKRMPEEERSKLTAENLWEIDSWIGECANTLREDAFVMICQLSAQLELTSQEESVSRPILTALIHWVVCSSAEAQDPLLPGVLSPLRYSLEAMCKLSVLEKNVDLILATPPWPRIEKMLEVLGGLLNLGEEIPCREFALVLVNAMCAASDVSSASTALNTPAVHYLVSFLEQADANMHQVVQAHGMQALRENPELMGTSVGMLRRAATVLQCLSRVPACRPRFTRHQQRLLQFTMSQLMDSRVAAIIADTLYELQKPTGELYQNEEVKEEEEDILGDEIEDKKPCIGESED